MCTSNEVTIAWQAVASEVDDRMTDRKDALQHPNLSTLLRQLNSIFNEDETSAQPLMMALKDHPDASPTEVVDLLIEHQFDEGLSSILEAHRHEAITVFEALTALAEKKNQLAEAGIWKQVRAEIVAAHLMSGGGRYTDQQIAVMQAMVDKKLASIEVATSSNMVEWNTITETLSGIALQNWPLIAGAIEQFKVMVEMLVGPMVVKAMNPNGADMDSLQAILGGFPTISLGDDSLSQLDDNEDGGLPVEFGQLFAGFDQLFGASDADDTDDGEQDDDSDPSTLIVYGPDEESDRFGDQLLGAVYPKDSDSDSVSDSDTARG